MCIDTDSSDEEQEQDIQNTAMLITTKDVSKKSIFQKKVVP
jgi:hypothetical protein